MDTTENPSTCQKWQLCRGAFVSSVFRNRRDGREGEHFQKSDHLREGKRTPLDLSEKTRSAFTRSPQSCVITAVSARGPSSHLVALLSAVKCRSMCGNSAARTDTGETRNVTQFCVTKTGTTRKGLGGWARAQPPRQTHPDATKREITQDRTHAIPTSQSDGTPNLNLQSRHQDTKLGHSFRHTRGAHTHAH